MLKKVNSTIITLGIAGVLAIAVGFYVNSVSWKPAGEEKKLAGTDETSSTDKASTPSYPTWAASATGRVEPKSGEVRITTEVPGRIEDIPVELNDTVKAGDLLIRLDDQNALTKVAAATAEANVRERERNNDSVRGLADERRTAEDSVATAERALFGARQAFDDALSEKRAGNGSDEAVTTARTNLDEAKKKLADERANLASVNAKAGMPLPTRVELGLAVARANLSAAELAVEKTRIRAPSDGSVLNVMSKEGEVAVPSPEDTLLMFRRPLRAQGARRGRGARRRQDPRRPARRRARRRLPRPGLRGPRELHRPVSVGAAHRLARARAAPTTWRSWRLSSISTVCRRCSRACASTCSSSTTPRPPRSSGSRGLKRKGQTPGVWPFFVFPLPAARDG